MIFTFCGIYAIMQVPPWSSSILTKWSINFSMKIFLLSTRLLFFWIIWSTRPFRLISSVFLLFASGSCLTTIEISLSLSVGNPVQAKPRTPNSALNFWPLWAKTWKIYLPANFWPLMLSKQLKKETNTWELRIKFSDAMRSLRHSVMQKQSETITPLDLENWFCCFMEKVKQT